MNQQIVAIVAQITLALMMVVGFVLLIVAELFDILQIKRLKPINKVRAKLRDDKRPRITVIVYAKNNERTILKCLKSIRGNHYGRYDVVVVDDMSRDKTRSKVRAFIRRNPDKPFRLYSKHKRSTKAKALKGGYFRSKKGDLVMIIDGAAAMPEGFMKDSAARFVFESKLNAMRFSSHVIETESITMLYYRFWQQSLGIIKKFRFFKNTRINVNESGVIYRRAVFLRALAAKLTVGKYDSDLILIDNSVCCDRHAVRALIPSKKRRVRLLGQNSDFGSITMSLIVLALQSYSIYAAASLQTPLLLILGCVAITLWLLLTTWSNGVLDLIEKMELSFCSLFIYYIIYAHLWMYVINFGMRLLTSLTYRRPVISASRAPVRYS